MAARGGLGRPLSEEQVAALVEAAQGDGRVGASMDAWVGALRGAGLLRD